MNRNAVLRTKRLSRAVLLAAGLAGALGGCGPRAAIPTRPRALPAALPGLLPADHPAARLSTALAPVLYLQADESFQLSRSVAVVHPDSQVIAYHLLWRDDVHGAWIPRTVPTDQEIVWVGYDSTGAPVRLWTYWHGTVLTTPWPHRQVAVDVQWGKHGSLPRNTVRGDLPLLQSLGMFYAFAWALPDIWLSRLNREGPLCFCGGFSRYREFTRAEPLAPHLDAIVVAADPGPTLAAVFGRRYSEKPAWPWLAGRR
jgi:hypothetical protein